MDLLEHSLEVGDAPIAGTQSRGIVERALEVLRDLAGTQGVAFAAGRRGRGSRGRAGATAGTRGVVVGGVEVGEVVGVEDSDCYVLLL